VDADALARNMDADQETVKQRVTEIASIHDPDDGVEYLTGTATTANIRGDALYSGVRVTMTARIATAQVKLRLDINFGDPVTPAPQLVDLPALGPGTEAIRVLGYPVETVLAEKLATAIDLGPASTRVRDYADIFVLTGTQALSCATLREALSATAAFRGTAIQPLSDAIKDIVSLRASTYPRTGEDSAPTQNTYPSTSPRSSKQSSHSPTPSLKASWRHVEPAAPALGKAKPARIADPNSLRSYVMSPTRIPGMASMIAAGTRRTRIHPSITRAGPRAPSGAGHPLVPAARPGNTPVTRCRQGRRGQRMEVDGSRSGRRGVLGFRTATMASDVQFIDQPVLLHAARVYSWTSPPRTSRHRIRATARSVTRTAGVACVRWPQVPGPVRAMLVVVRDILVQDCPQVPWPGDQHPVGVLSLDGPYPALGIGVRCRAARRDLHHLDPRA
jgi:hypothetical protein